jgi:hypothetical protein
MTPDLEFADAVRRLHRAKDAAYRDAWRRRGEVLSILANIARKVDRLEYGLGGAPATSGETLLDTAVDLLVYWLKYQAYLADIDHKTEPLSDGAQARKPGTAAFEALLSRADLTPLVTSGEQAAAAARRVLAGFAELEVCFAGLVHGNEMRRHPCAR